MITYKSRYEEITVAIYLESYNAVNFYAVIISIEVRIRIMRSVELNNNRIQTVVHVYNFYFAHRKYTIHKYISHVQMTLNLSKVISFQLDCIFDDYHI